MVTYAMSSSKATGHPADGSAPRSEGFDDAIRLLEMVSFGAYGRLYLGGGEAEIEEAAKAAIAVLKGVDGRNNPEPGI